MAKIGDERANISWENTEINRPHTILSVQNNI